MPNKRLEGVGYSFLAAGFAFQALKCFGWLGLSPEGPTALDALRGRRALGRMGPEAEAMLNAPHVIDRVDDRTVNDVKERVAHIQRQIREDSAKPIIREKALAVLTRKVRGPSGEVQWAVPEKDAEAEVIALFNAVRDAASDTALRYTRDHVAIDQFHAADKLLALKGGDCFVNGTLFLTDRHELVRGETVRVGDRIWGKDRWSTVTKTWDRGFRRTWRVRLNNGSAMRLTPNHHVVVLRCGRHVERVKSKACSCPSHERREEKIEVCELRNGDVLVRPGRIPFGKGEPDVDRTYVEGLYLSDGWSSKPSQFEIAGQDGCPEEEQKRQVRTICEHFGIPTTWYRKQISVRDREWTARMRTMGTHAPMKRAPTIDLAEGAAGALLRGIMADSGKNTSGNGRTFTTTSRALFVQTRVLHKMFGVTGGERYVTDHGGLGEHPVWRLQVWGGGAAERMPKLLRVAGIDRDNIELPCFDVETDDHYIYLPETDVTVLNCDDGVILLGSMLRSVGYPVRLRVIQDNKSDTWSHIYLLVGLPPTNPTKWVPLDWSMPDKPPGWEAPGAARVALSGRPSGVVVRLMDFRV